MEDILLRKDPFAQDLQAATAGTNDGTGFAIGAGTGLSMIASIRPSSRQPLAALTAGGWWLGLALPRLLGPVPGCAGGCDRMSWTAYPQRTVAVQDFISLVRQGVWVCSRFLSNSKTIVKGPGQKWHQFLA